MAMDVAEASFRFYQRYARVFARVSKEGVVTQFKEADYPGLHAVIEQYYDFIQESVKQISRYLKNDPF
jgi:hypothetical protein